MRVNIENLGLYTKLEGNRMILYSEFSSKPLLEGDEEDFFLSIDFRAIVFKRRGFVINYRNSSSLYGLACLRPVETPGFWNAYSLGQLYLCRNAKWIVEIWSKETIENIGAKQKIYFCSDDWFATYGTIGKFDYKGKLKSLEYQKANLPPKEA